MADEMLSYMIPPMHDAVMISETLDPSIRAARRTNFTILPTTRVILVKLSTEIAR
jgi:hypothetical protein